MSYIVHEFEDLISLTPYQGKTAGKVQAALNQMTQNGYRLHSVVQGLHPNVVFIFEKAS